MTIRDLLEARINMAHRTKMKAISAKTPTVIPKFRKRIGNMNHSAASTSTSGRVIHKEEQVRDNVITALKKDRHYNRTV